MTNINLEKFCHYFNEKSITATTLLEYSTWEVNLSKKQELGYLSSGIIPNEAVDSDQGHFLAPRYSVMSLI